MSQLKLILFVGFVCLYQINGAPITLTQKMYEDLLTKDTVTYLNQVEEKVKDPSVFAELAKIEDTDKRYKVAREKYPTAYILMTEYSDARNKRMESLGDGNAEQFYADYMNTVTDTIGPGTDLSDNFVKFINIIIPKWVLMGQESRDAFAKEFPEIAKILNDKEIQKLGNADKALINPNVQTKSVWQQIKGLFG